jgi:putative exosortase-associated protein (TIGR04073 family)
MILVLGGVAPYACAETRSEFLNASRDKAARGAENAVFGVMGEVSHHIKTRSEKGVVEGWTLGLFDGAYHGIVRTLVGVYELATPYYHDEPYLPTLEV